MHPFQLRVPLPLADLQLALGQDLKDDVVEGRFRAEGFGEILGRRGLAFADGEENGGDLEHVVQVRFDAAAPFQHFVFVAGDFEAFFSCGWGEGLEGVWVVLWGWGGKGRTFFEADEGDVGETDLVRGLGEISMGEEGRMGRTYLIDSYGHVGDLPLVRLWLGCMAAIIDKTATENLENENNRT